MSQPVTVADRRTHAALAARLAAIGFVLPGSLLTDHFQRCGKRSCRCHADPPALHGPYAQWTRTEHGKTVTRLLRPEDLAVYSAWFDNARTLHQLVTELHALGVNVVERNRAQRR